VLRVATRVDRLADECTQRVRAPIERRVASPVADGVDVHRRHGVDGVGHGSQDRRPRRRQQLSVDGTADERECGSSTDLDDGRGRNGVDAVAHLDCAPAHGNWCGDHSVDLEVGE
jgi:hypothetical protein